MTIAFIESCIQELRFVADSLLAEVAGSEHHRQHIHAALFNIERAITELHEAKEGISSK